MPPAFLSVDYGISPQSLCGFDSTDISQITLKSKPKRSSSKAFHIVRPFVSKHFRTSYASSQQTQSRHWLFGTDWNELASFQKLFSKTKGGLSPYTTRTQHRPVQLSIEARETMTNQAIQDTEPQKTYTVTQLCKEFGVTARTLRFYEQHKLLAPARPRGWTRIFSHRDRVRLQLILRGKRFGFSLLEINELLDLCDKGDGPLTLSLTTLPKLQAQLELLRKKRDELTEAIADLESCCEQLKGPLSVYNGRNSRCAV